jgi:hypothetical protein
MNNVKKAQGIVVIGKTPEVGVAIVVSAMGQASMLSLDR